MASSALSQKHILAGKRIIVAGAGLAGLAFARALDLNWPSHMPRPEVVLYERSSKHQDISRNGYTMGIRGETGLAALHSLQLLDQALASSTTGASPRDQQPVTFWTKDWQPIFQAPHSDATSPPKGTPPGTPDNIRLVRHVLRDMLLSGIPAHTRINFDVGCTSASHLPNGKMHINLSNGSTDTCDLLIAADGANSLIRTSLLPDEKLTFAGIVCYIGTSHFPSGKPPLLAKNWGMALSGQGVPFLTFPVDANSGVWALSYRAPAPEERIRGSRDPEHLPKLLKEIRAKGKMFAQPFDDFVSATDPITLAKLNAMHKYPIRHAAVSTSAAPVIFIGDANHPMSPFSGNGANMALRDAVMLAKELCQPDVTTLRSAIDAFDEESIPRSTTAIDRSFWVIRLLHARGWEFWLFRILLGLVGTLTSWKKK